MITEAPTLTPRTVTVDECRESFAAERSTETQAVRGGEFLVEAPTEGAP